MIAPAAPLCPERPNRPPVRLGRSAYREAHHGRTPTLPLVPPPTHPLTDNAAPAANPRLRQAHCPNPQCDWCLPCVARREAAIKAGRQDLLEPVQAVPAETDCEQTREIPAVRDEIPPDQMT